MKKESVLLVANFSSNTGYAWKFIYKIFNIIARNLHEKNISICLSFARIVEPVTILDSDIPFHAFVFDPRNKTLNELLSLWKEIKQQNIKYAYFTDHGSYNWLYALLRLWGVKKIVAHSHVSVANPDPPASETGIKKLIKTLLNHIKFVSADSVYVVSDFVKDRMVRKACCPAYRVIKILNGIDIDRFNCSENKREKDKVKIFICCRATKYKGVHVLIEAIKLLTDHYSVADFLVEYAGDGPDIGEFKEKVRKLQIEEKFIFLGQLADTREKICNADIIVIPSIWGDACPLTVMEAMAASKALVTTRAGGIPEIVGNSENGCLIPHSNSELLAKELAKLISDEEKRDRLGKKARARAIKMFREDAFYKKVTKHLLADFGMKEHEAMLSSGYRHL